MVEKKELTVKNRKKLHDSLDRSAKKLERRISTKPGAIVLRLSGVAGGDFGIECIEGQVRVNEFVAAEAGPQPIIEIMGDANTVRRILDGEIDARARFLAGGLRVRGDLRYLSDLALELGVLKQPL